MSKFTPIAYAYARACTYADKTSRQIAKEEKLPEDLMYVKNTGSITPTSRRAFFRYDISGIGADAKIRLSLTGAAIKSDWFTAMSVYEVTEPWDEMTLTWNNAPATGKRLASGILYGADLTDAIRAAKAAGRKDFSICIESDVFTDGQIPLPAADIFLTDSAEDDGLAVRRRFSDNEEEDAKVWAHAKKLVDEWLGGEYAALYAKTEDAFEVPATDISKCAGTHTVRQDARASNPVGIDGGIGALSTVYARTIDTMKSAGGYVQTEPDVVFDTYGGMANAAFKGKATGFFHIEYDGKRPYIIDPEGNPFFVVGANTINTGSTENQRRAVLERYGSEDNYWTWITKRLGQIGINTVTGSVDRVISTATPVNAIASVRGISAYMHSMKLSTSTGGSSAFAFNNTMNLFDPAFPVFVEEQSRPILEKYRNEPHIVGYTSDNELPGMNNLLERYLTLDPTEPIVRYSYAAAWSFLEARAGKNVGFDGITLALREEWKAFMFNQLFKTVSAVIKRYDPNHMYIGTRVHGTNRTSEGYLRAAGHYCEMLTINLYGGLEPQTSIPATIYRYSGRPFIVTEFYSKAMDAPDMNGHFLANQVNAGWIVRTQNDRANMYENYTMLMLECRYCTGWVWYRFQDNDQSLYTNDGGKTVLRVFQKGDRYAIISFLDQDGNVVPATGNETQIYVGERDTSNLGSNKGFFDNYMNEYTVVTRSITRIARHTTSLIRYFDELHK